MGKRGKSKYTGKFKPGHKFGEWTVTTGNVMGSPATLNVQCKCGVDRYVDAYTLVKGKSTSCGCDRTGENAPNWQGVHGLSKTAISRTLTYSGGSLNATNLVNCYVAQTGSCGVTGHQLTSENARLERSDPSKPYQPNNILWVHDSIAPLVAEYGVAGTISIANAVVSNSSLSTDNMQGVLHADKINEDHEKGRSQKANQKGHKKVRKEGKTSRTD